MTYSRNAALHLEGAGVAMGVSPGLATPSRGDASPLVPVTFLVIYGRCAFSVFWSVSGELQMSVPYSESGEECLRLMHGREKYKPCGIYMPATIIQCLGI